MTKQVDYMADLLNDVTPHKRNIHIHRRIRTNDPWSPRATYVLSVPGIVVAAAAETPCGLVMCTNCNPVYFKQMACFSTLCNTISLNIRVNDKSLFFFFQSPNKFKCNRKILSRFSICKLNTVKTLWNFAKQHLSLLNRDPFTGFSTFDWEQLAKICQHAKKNATRN